MEERLSACLKCKNTVSPDQVCVAKGKGEVNHFGVHGTFKPPRVLCNTSMRFSLTFCQRRFQALLSTPAPSQIRTCPRITSSCLRLAPLSNKVRKGSFPLRNLIYRILNTGGSIQDLEPSVLPQDHIYLTRSVLR